MTCCNFLISQIYASFHLEPLVYKEMDTKIKIITDFYGQPKNPLYDLTSFILQEFFNSDGNPVQLILYDSNLNSPAAMAIKWASYCSNCEDKKKKKKNRCLRHLKCITSDRHIENVCASYTFWKLLAQRDKICIRCMIHYTLCILSQMSCCWSLQKTLSPFLFVLSLILCFSVSWDQVFFVSFCLWLCNWISYFTDKGN